MSPWWSAQPGPVAQQPDPAQPPATALSRLTRLLRPRPYAPAPPELRDRVFSTLTRLNDEIAAQRADAAEYQRGAGIARWTAAGERQREAARVGTVRRGRDGRFLGASERTGA
jgi:hypothetical protein